MERRCGRAARYLCEPRQPEKVQNVWRMPTANSVMSLSAAEVRPAGRAAAVSAMDPPALADIAPDSDRPAEAEARYARLEEIVAADRRAAASPPSHETRGNGREFEAAQRDIDFMGDVLQAFKRAIDDAAEAQEHLPFGGGVSIGQGQTLA